MTTITRQQDHLQFVASAYRELLPMTKRHTLVKEIRALVEQQGGYLQLFKKSDGQVEVALAKEPGYLLGETVWHYFDMPDYLIFCEPLLDSDQVILVVVQAAMVFLDVILPRDQVQQELLPILTNGDEYQVYVCGDSPLREREAAQYFALPKNKVNQFVHQDLLLLPRLPALPQFQLLPLPLAMRTPLLSRGFPLWQTALLLLVLIGVGWWLWLPHPSQVVAKQAKPKIEKTWRAYHFALESPAPQAQLIQLAHAINQLYLIPGWQIASMTADANQLTADMHIDGGTLQGLSQWAQRYKFNYLLTSQAPQLQVSLQSVARKLPINVADTQQVVTTLIDRIDSLLTAQSVSVKDPVMVGRAKRLIFTIYVNQITPQVLLLLANELANYPVALDAIDLNFTQYVFSGTIQLSAWGR